MERLSDVIDAKSEGGEYDRATTLTTRIWCCFPRRRFHIYEGSPSSLIQFLSLYQLVPLQVLLVAVEVEKYHYEACPPHEPNSGRILIDGYDISKLQLGSVRRQIGIVPQDSSLFEGTIRDNIALTTPDASYEILLLPLKSLVS